MSEKDYSCYMDINTFRRSYREYMKALSDKDRMKAQKALMQYGRIMVCVDSVANVSDVQNEIEAMGLQSTSLSNTLEPLKKTANMLEMVLGGIGAIAMIVSAISITNTMIMSIYERTKEIGVMKVLGCYVTDVRKLFLFEPGMIGMIGGAVGVVFSYIGSYVINTVGSGAMNSMFGDGMEQDPSSMSQAIDISVIPLWLPIAAIAFGMLVGLIAGYYPVRRATRISAIEAIKSAE